MRQNRERHCACIAEVWRGCSDIPFTSTFKKNWCHVMRSDHKCLVIMKLLLIQSKYCSKRACLAQRKITINNCYIIQCLTSVNFPRLLLDLASTISIYKNNTWILPPSPFTKLQLITALNVIVNSARNVLNRKCCAVMRELWARLDGRQIS